MSSLLPLVVRDAAKSYGAKVVLDGIDLTVNPGEPVGLVGENGSGKSTLLRVVVGVEQVDAGEVSLPPDVGYVAQDLPAQPGATVGTVLDAALAPMHDAVERLEQLAATLEDARSAAEYAATLEWATYHDAWDADRRTELASVRLGLGALDRSRQVDSLSGGERMRLALAAMIASRPACVVLDEPTNHLDDAAIEFLESFLLDLPGVVVVASHDRMFLDRVCSVIVDLDAGYFGVDGVGGRRFGGGFSAYLEHKAASRHRWEETYAAQQDELNDLRRSARTTARQVGHAGRAPRDNDKNIVYGKTQIKQAAVSRRVRNVERRIEVLERNQVPRPPRPLTFRQPLTSTPAAGGSSVFVRHLHVPGRLELERLDLASGDHLLITGPNGSGKSTLLAVLAGHLPATSGSVSVTAGRTGLLAQEVRFSDLTRTPLQLYHSATGSPVPLSDLGLLHPRDLSRPTGVLSVGQQRRLALAILVAGGVDLLLLDEPTNHISVTLAGELEDALDRTVGTVIIASHDRWLRRRWQGTTLALGDERRIVGGFRRIVGDL